MIEGALRIGLLSFAHVHAAGYATLLRDRPGVELRAADPDGISAAGHPRGAELAEALQVRFLPSYDAVFDWSPHAVIVCSETSRHRDLVIRAAEAGCAVLCEKPLATTVSDAESMVEACDRAGVALMTAYPVGFHPAFAALKAAVAAGSLGPMIAAAGTNNGAAPFAARPWFADPDLAGGGALMDHVVHVADLLDQLLGEPASQVYAQTNRVLYAEGVEVETGGLVAITYPSGLRATIDCSWSVPSSYPAWGGLSLTVEGTKGSARFDPFVERVEVYHERPELDGYGPDLDDLMLDEFLAAVREGRPAQPDGSAGLRTLRIVAAAQASAATSRPVAIGP